MSINHLANIMRMHAEAVTSSNQNYMTIMATINNYDPNTYTATVNFQPDDILSGYLPIMTPWCGDNWGLFCPPTAGDQVEVQFQEGSVNAGIICLRAFSQEAKPLAVESGEFWLVHKSGSFVKLTNDGNVSISSITGDISINAENNVNIAINTDNNGKVNINGDVEVTGNIVASGDITDQKSSMEDIRTKYNQHTHPFGGLPSPQMPV